MAHTFWQGNWTIILKCTKLVTSGKDQIEKCIENIKMYILENLDGRYVTLNSL